MTKDSGKNEKSCDLSVELCGVRLKNPLIAASGTFGFGREFDELYDISCWGAIAVKGLTLSPRKGNPPVRSVETASGMLNSVGLQNPGVRAFLQDELPFLEQRKITVIANVAGSTQEEYVEAVRLLADSSVSLVELNISCPNVKEGGVQFGTNPNMVRQVTAAVKKVCRQPLMVKLSPNVTDIVEIALAAQEGGADALSLINTLTGMAVDLQSRRPILANITGGLSGPAIKPIALRMVWQVANAVDLPVVGMGGIVSGKDAAEFLTVGATAVMAGTVNITDPFSGERLVQELEKIAAQFGVLRIADLTGSLQIKEKEK